MNKVQKQIYDSVVKPALNAVRRTAIGRVEAFYLATMTGTISIENDTLEDQFVYYENVALAFQPSLKNSLPMAGDNVMVEFINGEGKNPVIVGLLDNDIITGVQKTKYKHNETGGSISDIYLEREGEKWS